MSSFSPDAASTAQIAAADPATNVWLVANAGSGKTKVLTDRVARLLLGGVDPQHILCLTYTKAAAAEMQNRLFQRLGAWAMADDDALRDSLIHLGEERQLDEVSLRRARRLFARAIETPGGIRIQTIHSFCAGLLRRFPLEAGISPAFVELDERSGAILRDDILEQMATGPDAALLQSILPDSGEGIGQLLAEVVSHRAELMHCPDKARLLQIFGLMPGMDEARLLDETFGPDDLMMLRRILPALQAGSTNDQKAAAKLAALPDRPDMGLLERLEEILLYGGSAKNPFGARIGAFPTRDTRGVLGKDLPALESLMERVARARPLRLALHSFNKSSRLHAFAARFLALHEAAKARHGWLDFDDFINRAIALLTSPAIAPWVLYKLDGAIDHILVDEAQDTSPRQWRIIAALTEDFTAGDSAHSSPRSLFVVGDKKQSIYSFQGADVVEFDQWKEEFAARFQAIGAGLKELPLEYSFRSSPVILSLVDACFDNDRKQALGGSFAHRAFATSMPGRVEIWPVVPDPESPDPGEWYEPVDLIRDTDASVVLAERIALRIKEMIETGVQIPDNTVPSGFRPVRAGDFLILVQRRDKVFEAIIRACKTHALPIAGADRLTLSAELAVRDILALLAFLNTPEDDLSLAVALRSPIFGWKEAELYALAQPRKGYLWEALRDWNAPETLRILKDLRDNAEFLRPYELIEAILIRHGGRARILGRLGTEVADSIDELCQQALIYERTEVPSLTGFLAWMAAGEVEIKRQVEGEGNQIRVMTVHGAKGLEAPIVILPDAADRRLEEKARIMPLAQNVMSWAGRKGSEAATVDMTKTARAEAREAENLRLLYVAMTRAKCWLIVAAAGKCGDDSWHQIVRAGVERLGAIETETGHYLQSGVWPDKAPAASEAAPAPHAVPSLLPVPPAPDQPALYSPSRLGGTVFAGNGPVDESGMDSEEAMKRGTALHLALQHMAGMPESDWPRLIRQLSLPDDLASEIGAILRAPDLAWIFGDGSLPEVEMACPWQDGWLSGAIDRLVVTSESVTIIDFKSNHAVPSAATEVPEAYLRQLGAYLHAVSALYPGREVRTAILWTRLPLLMPVDPGLAQTALARVRILDGRVVDP